MCPPHLRIQVVDSVIVEVVCAFFGGLDEKNSGVGVETRDTHKISMNL